MSQSNNNIHIAKNTIYLYIRTVVVLFISLYSSRLVLQVIGISDFGLYNLVGGIVTLMAFLQAAQAKATSRFIIYKVGENSDSNGLKKVFSACMTIHIFIAFAVVILGETIGLWMVYHWISIPPERFTAALWVYQFALLTFCIQIIRIPYDSVIIAHEDMSIYAYISIFEVVLQLILIFCLKYVSGDSLILYSGLLSILAFVLFKVFRLYVLIKRPVYKFSFVWDRNSSMKIISLSGWTLLGSASNTATQQGVSILLNNFVGLVANAALGFASQVSVGLGKFINSFTTAFNPQVIKLYAQQDYPALHSLIFRASKFSFALAYVMALPLIYNMDFILQIWLTNVPKYTTEFCQLILICSIIDATTSVYNVAITATGTIRNYQICISCSFILDLFFAFFLLSLHVNPALVFGSRIMTRGVLNMFIGLYFCRAQLSLNIVNYSKWTILPIIITIIISLPIEHLICHYYDSWEQFFISTFASVIIVGTCTLFIIMTKHERITVKKTINKYFSK